MLVEEVSKTLKDETLKNLDHVFVGNCLTMKNLIATLYKEETKKIFLIFYPALMKLGI